MSQGDPGQSRFSACCPSSREDPVPIWTSAVLVLITVLLMQCNAMQFNLNCIALHCTALHYIALHCIALYYITLHSDFTPVTPAEVSQLLRSMSNKSSPLDYIPTSLLKSCADTFSILISHLANQSFTQATFPSKFKLALISPLLKKSGLPKSDLANFRPISNLNTIGKILERLALARFFLHISKSPSFSPLQSAYRKFYSTETALLKLTNDIMETIDSGKITILTALDMSAAFDTLDHVTRYVMLCFVILFVMLCYVMLCYVMLCYVMLCYVMLCYVMLCYVMLCYVMLCYVMLCYVMLCYVMLCYVMLCYVMLCYVMLCYVMLCYVMLCYVMLCYVMLCYVMLCYVMLCYVMLCYVMLCYVMLCYVMLCYVMLCYVMLCYVMLCYVMLCYVMLCYVMLCYVMLCYVMLCYVMLCYVMLCYVMLCYVMLCYVMLCYHVMLSLGFAHIWPTAHPLWKLTRHPHLPPPYSQACLRALF